MNDKHHQRLMFLEEIAKANKGVCIGRNSYAKLAAAIYVKNRLISIGMNSSKSSPFQKRFSKNKNHIYIHAEIGAIKQAISNMGLNEFVDAKKILYVCRVKRFTQNSPYIWGLSKPCIGCQSAIMEFNINKVIYSLDEDEMNGKFYEIMEF